MKRDDPAPDSSFLSSFDSLTFFSLIWAMTTILMWGFQYPWWRDGRASGLLVLAFWSLFRPASVGRLLSLIAAQALLILQQFPFAGEQLILILLINLTFLIAFIRMSYLERSFSVTREKLFSEFVGPVRLELLIFYFLVAFGKYNTDFLAYKVSCGAKHYLQLAKQFPFFPTAPWAQIAALSTVLAVESAVPLLLIFPRTRALGVVMGAWLHFLIGINFFPGNTFYGISALFLGLFISLFAPSNFSTLLKNYYRCRLGPKIGQRMRGLLLFFLFLIFAGIYEHRLRQTLGFHFFPHLLWWGYGLSLIALFVLALRLEQPYWPGPRAFFRLGHPLYALFLILILLDGLLPYLGFKTVGSFHSNLMTEGGVSNHLVFPASIQVANFQKDLVRVLDSTDPFLRRQAERGNLFPYFVLRSYISQATKRGEKNIRLSYTRAGKQKSLDNAERDPELSKPYPWILRKTMFFRAIHPGQRTPVECEENPEWDQYLIF